MASSTTPFFGRAYSLTVTPKDGGQEIVISSDSFEPEALRFTFDVYQYAYKAFWLAEIAVYNPDGVVTSGDLKGSSLFDLVIKEGDTVTLRAGYQADYPYPSVPPVIWSGPVYYTIKDRVDVVDHRLTFHCVINRALTKQNFINSTIPGLSKRFAQAQFIAQESVTKIDLNTSTVQSVLGDGQLPRAKTYFGTPDTYLHALAEDQGALSWFQGTKFEASFIDDPLGDVVTTYAPPGPGEKPRRQGGKTYTVIGTPQQTQVGVQFRTLLDPNVQVKAPIVRVGLEDRYVRPASFTYGSFPPLILTGQYAVVGVHFFGDSRGNEWYSDITGVSQIQNVFQLMAF